MSSNSEENVSVSRGVSGRQTTESVELDLGELFAYLWGGKWLILLITVLAIIAAGFYAFVATPVYQTDVLLQVEKESSSMPGLDEVSESLAADVSGSAEIEIIRSRNILGKAVDELNLTVHARPLYFPVIGEALARRHGGENPAQPPFFSDWVDGEQYAWGGERIAVDRFETDGISGGPWRLEALGEGRYRLLDAGETVLEGEAGEPSKAAYRGGSVGLFVAELKARPGTRFVLNTRTRQSAVMGVSGALSVTEQGRDTGILRLQMQGTDPERIQRIADSVANHYLRQNVERKSQEAQNMLEFIQRQLPEQRSQLETAEARLNEYRAETGSVDLSLEAQQAVSKMSEIEGRISELEMKRNELKENYTAAHPAMQSVDRQMAGLQADRQAMEAQLRDLPETEQQAVRLTRDVKVANELYLTMLNNAQELKVAKAGTVGNVRIIDRALDPRAPIAPRKGLILAAGLVAGLLLGVGLVLLRRMLDRGMVDPEEIERQTGYPVYASVLYSTLQSRIARALGRGKGAGNRLLAHRDPKDLSIESLRSLRTSLQFALMRADNNIIAVSGPAPEVGKSFVSANFAAVLADAGKKVLLIDGDMRKGHLHEYFGVGRRPGLSEVISGDTKPSEALHAIGENLEFLPTGTLPPNPAELLMSDRFKRLLDAFSDRYDLVLIDTPPILAVTDGGIIARHAGTNFTVLKAGQHPLREINAALKHFERVGVRPDGFVMNAVTRSQNRYGQYGQYYYHYAYGK